MPLPSPPSASHRPCAPGRRGTPDPVLPARRGPARLASHPLRALAGGLALALAGCGGGDSTPSDPTPPPPPAPTPVASVEVTGTPPGPLVVGTTVQLQARALSATGSVLSGRPLAWSTSDAAVAAVSGSGLVTGVAPGTATITATSETRTASVQIQVIPPPVASVQVTPPEAELEVGDTLTLTATLRDASGNLLTDREVAWSSLSPQVAEVAPDGVVTATGVGTAVLMATSEGEDGAATVQVRSATAPRILGIEPAELMEGETATIQGIRFDPSPGGTTVRLGERATEILSISETSLTFRVPAGGCHPQGTEPVRVQVGEEADERLQPFRPSGLLDLTPGELHLLRAPDDLCLQLPELEGGGSWMVGIQSVAQTPELRTPVRVAARVSGRPDLPFAGTSFGNSLRSAPLPLSGPWPSPGVGTLPPGPGLLPEGMDRHAQAHLDHMLQQEAFARTHLTGTRLAGASTGAAPARVPAGAAVGDTVHLRISTGVSCVATPARPLVVRYRGPRHIIVTDPVPGPADYTQAELEAMGALLDNEIHPRLEASLGAFTDRDGNGRVVTIISQHVNEASTALGFVRYTDLLDPAVCPESNGGEYLYVIAPDPDAPPTSQLSPAGARADFPRLAAHELGHVIQIGRRGAASLSIMPIWAVEGQAVMAEEMVARGILGFPSGANLGRSVALAPHGPTETGWFSIRFGDLAFYYGFLSATERAEGAPAGCGWLGREGAPVGIRGPCATNRLPYGVSWSFQRHVMDHYAHRVGGEEAFLRAFTELPALSLSAVGALVGEDYRDLLARWAAALWADGRGSGFAPELTFPSWDLRDIENAYVATARFTPIQEGFTPFEREMVLASGSSAYLQLSGQARPGMALRVTSGSGAPAPGTVQLWVVRVP